MALGISIGLGLRNHGASTQAGARGGVFELEQFQVTDNGGEPFQVDDAFATPENFMVRA